MHNADKYKRICIIGPSCSGKSTLAEKLGKKLNLPVLHIDQIAHIPGTNWVLRPRDETKNEHDDFIKKDAWIIDGQYKKLMPKRFERSDTIILLKVNRFVCCWRFLKRCFKGGNRPGKLDGATKEFNWEMIRFILYHQPRRWKEQMQIISAYPHIKIIPLKTFKEADDFLEAL